MKTFLTTLAWDLFLLESPLLGPVQPVHHRWLPGKGGRKGGDGVGNSSESTDEFG